MRRQVSTDQRDPENKNYSSSSLLKDSILSPLANCKNDATLPPIHSHPWRDKRPPTVSRRYIPLFSLVSFFLFFIEFSVCLIIPCTRPDPVIIAFQFMNSVRELKEVYYPFMLIIRAYAQHRFFLFLHRSNINFDFFNSTLLLQQNLDDQEIKFFCIYCVGVQPLEFCR